jgi:hypothetical protein
MQGIVGPMPGNAWLNSKIKRADSLYTNLYTDLSTKISMQLKVQISRREFETHLYDANFCVHFES